MMKREDLLADLASHPEKEWDVLVIGGGATGLGVALDAASRGFSTLLLEKVDFAKGTSSRSTKLVHGGVRYLAKGDVALVREALKERGLLLKNAPHLVKSQKFLIPSYNWWTGPYYTLGLKVYDWMSGAMSFGKSIFISSRKALHMLPNLKKEGLKGGTIYFDGQFDDTRLAVNLAQTILNQGGIVLNYMEVKNLIKASSGKVAGVIAQDKELGIDYEIKAKAVINATGVFLDDVLKMDEPSARKLVRPSQGVHIVLDKKFLPGEAALMVPKTSDGRVLFAIPWHDKVVVGTTDTPIDEASEEPTAQSKEIDFILETARAYLAEKPEKDDILSIFAGLRPLAAPQGNSQSTKEISRNHKIFVSKSNLITITGGKWTTYRKMGLDTIEKAIQVCKLPAHKSTTKDLALHGYQKESSADELAIYGSDADFIRNLIKEDSQRKEKIHPRLNISKAEVIWGTRQEMARQVEDILARRTRALFLDAQASWEAAPLVASIMAQEMQKDERWEREQVSLFREVTKSYLPK